MKRKINLGILNKYLLMSILSTVLFLLRTRKLKCPLGQKTICVLKDKKLFVSFRTKKVICPLGQEKIYVLEEKKTFLSFRSRKVACPWGHTKWHVL